MTSQGSLTRSCKPAALYIYTHVYIYIVLSCHSAQLSSALRRREREKQNAEAGWRWTRRATALSGGQKHRRVADVTTHTVCTQKQKSVVSSIRWLPQAEPVAAGIHNTTWLESACDSSAAIAWIGWRSLRHPNYLLFSCCHCSSLLVFNDYNLWRLALLLSLCAFALYSFVS